MVLHEDNLHKKFQIKDYQNKDRLSDVVTFITAKT